MILSITILVIVMISLPSGSAFECGGEADVAGEAGLTVEVLPCSLVPPSARML